ncbi:MAG TPA: histidine ammonia-lyase [Bdellovibrionota bacterium]|nr:histidine ammonia-lyase [Bdellovibrionota bacterium]
MSSLCEITLDGHSLEPETLYRVARTLATTNEKVRIKIADAARERIRASADFVKRVIAGDKAVYGINTGFGKFAEVSIAKEKLCDLQKNLILSHCCGVGQPFERSLVFCATLIRLNVLCRGNSGVRPETVDALVASLETRFIASVPSQGSVGASGDLAPSAHVIAALMGYGEAEFFDGKTWRLGDAGELLALAKLKPLELAPKEGLALINGTQFTAAYAAHGLHSAKALLDASLLTLAMSIEGLRASHGIFNRNVVESHNHPGSVYCADKLAAWLPASTAIAESHENCGRVQDPYSLRCAPQVQGALFEEIQDAEETIRLEINCSTDNPLIFVNDGPSGSVRSGGNFHAIHSARVNDSLASCITTLASICERRVFLAMSPDLNAGLPAFLSPEGGLNSGLMIAQVTAAALVSENKALSFPASVDSIPTSDNKEDHVSMGPIAGKKLSMIIDNTWHVLGIELLSAAQALHLLRPLKSSPAIESLLVRYRKEVSPFDRDRYFASDINAATKFLKDEFL